MSFLTQISKTFSVEQTGTVAIDAMIAELIVDELYFNVSQMPIDGQLVDVIAPNVKSREDQQQLLFKIEMPDVICDGLKVELSERVLLVYADKRNFSNSENQNSRVGYGMYINLPDEVDIESINYQFDDDLLRLEFKKDFRRTR